MRTRTVTLAAAAAGLLLAAACRADPLVEAETRAAAARASHGVTGRGVAVAILDRGIDWTHADFRNADGSTRIAWIFDLTDGSGAGAPGNTYGAGTIYSAAQINAALTGGPVLATRDAVGHGTATAGNCCGNGRASNGRYVGIAPEATLIVVKFTSDGAAAHDGQPAEPAFYRPELFGKAIDFALDKARELGMPLVMLANFGSQGDRADGSDAFATRIDATVGPGKPGLAFVTGTGDDGGRNNHASATLGAGQTLQLPLRKGIAGTTLVQLWYPAGDRFDVSVRTPGGSYGPYAAPANNTGDTRTTADFTYGHNGSTFYGDRWRLIYLQLTGPLGDYRLDLTARSLGTSASAGSFEATISPGFHFSNDANRFLAFTQPGKTIWPGASARWNIAPNSYVFRTSWTDLDGVTRSVTDEGAPGELWQGSSIGPTWDGRTGVDLSAPGDRTITTYSPTSFWATARGNLVADGGGRYGIASAVSAAAPLVAGTVALMLQRNPQADAAALKSALQRSARADAFTGTVPNPRFGWGKLDTQAALAAIGLPPVPRTVIDCIFGWAERSYPQVLAPAGAATGTLDVYTYRYYADTRTYLAVSAADNHVWALGPVSGDVPLDVGPVSAFRPLAGCPG